MIKKIKKVIHDYHMLENGDKVLVCVSGGADSMCLLSVLMQMQEACGIELAAVHVNHQLRGADSLAEEQYVRQFCAEAGIPFAAEYADVAGSVQKMGWTVEEAGRNLRYQLFDKACADLGCNKIAVAHHLEDVAETVLFYMFRGTGLKGMQGIPPVRGRIIRPLIETGKEEIEGYLSEKGIAWYTDQSNFSDAYTRNKIRRHILSYAKQEINAGASAHIAQLTKQMAELYQYIEKETQKACRHAVQKLDGSSVIDVEAFLGYPPVIRKELLMQVLGRKDVSSAHIEALEELFSRQSGTGIQLKNGTYASREFDKVRIRHQERPSGAGQNEIYIQIPGIFKLPWLDRSLKMDIIKYDASVNIPKNTCTKWFDYDKIETAVTLRARQPKDVIQINRAGGHKSIKALYIEQKVALGQRDRILVLAAGSSVLWVPGIRGSEGYHVDAGTKHVLRAEIV